MDHISTDINIVKAYVLIKQLEGRAIVDQSQQDSYREQHEADEHQSKHMDMPLMGHLQHKLLRGSDGWVNCPNDPFTRCFGIAGLPGYENPDISNGIGGVEYLLQVIEHIESKLTSRNSF